MDKKLVVVAAATLALGIGIGSMWTGNSSTEAHADEASEACRSRGREQRQRRWT